MKRILFLILLITMGARAQDTLTNAANVKAVWTACDDIGIEKDKFTGEVTKFSPSLRPVVFDRVNNTVYLKLNTKGSTLLVGEKGVIMILSDGTRINRPNEKIDVEYDDGYEYSVFITLSNSEITRLKSAYITDFRLYIFDQEVSNAELYKDYLKCIASDLPKSKPKSKKKK